MAALFEHIRAQRMPKGTPAMLPDEPADESAPYGLPRIRWAPGARDGVAVFHVPGRPPGLRQTAPIVDALLDYARAANAETRGELESVVTRVVGDDAFVHYVGPILDRLEAALDKETSLVEQQMPAAVRKLLLETEQRDVLKLSIALLGAFGSPDDRDRLETVGLHDEFTLYAIDALGSVLADPIDSWMLFAVSLSGWGKIHAVLALVEKLPEAGTRRDEVVHYLLRFGCENGVQNGYVALPIAESAKLHEALGARGTGAPPASSATGGGTPTERETPAPKLDADLLVGAGVILSSLAEDAAQGGPGGDMGEYGEGAIASERYVAAVGAAGSAVAKRLDAFLAVASLRAFVRDTIPLDPVRWVALGWNEERCRTVVAGVEAFLASDHWRPLALATLQQGDAGERWKARAVCRVLEVPMATELEFVVGADPSDVGAWHDLSAQADREGIERAVSSAPALLRLDKLFATGPSTTLGFGPDFPRFEICDSLADALSRFPGSGGAFLRKLLESPSVRNRHSALRAYETWPQLGPDDRAAIAVVAAGDPDGRVREHAEKLKLEKG